MSTKTAAEFIRVLQISDTYVNLDTDKVFVHFLIFRVSNMSYINFKIDSTTKIAETKGHEHIILSFIVITCKHVPLAL